MIRKTVFILGAAMGAASVLSAQQVTPEHEAKARELVEQMTLEEKIDYIGGYNTFFIRPVERLGIPEIRMADGPQGVRNDFSAQLTGRDKKSTLYPCGMAAAATWDRELVYRMGTGIGQDARARGVHIVLGPGVNIYRSPLCGRNFEYYGEDPYLVGETAASMVEGIQDCGVMACAKHFAANNQEWDRYNTSSDLDERTLHEIYLPSFEKMVHKAGIGALMCGYHIINSVHSSEYRYLNVDVLRGRWGYTVYCRKQANQFIICKNIWNKGTGMSVHFLWKDIGSAANAIHVHCEFPNNRTSYRAFTAIRTSAVFHPGQYHFLRQNCRAGKPFRAKSVQTFHDRFICGIFVE